jgi:hypothetical protein
MTRKTSQIRPSDPVARPSRGSSSQVHSVAPLKPTKLSLESLLAETPENNRDEAWEKMAPEGKEF